MSPILEPMATHDDDRFHVPEATLGGAVGRPAPPANGDPATTRATPRDDGWESLALTLGIGLFLVIDALIVFAVVGSTTRAAAVVGVAFGGSIVGIWIIMRLLWRPLGRRLPERPVESGADRRSFQSARLGVLGGFNHCLVIESDTAHVHVRLMRPFSWLAPGAISIPRSSLADVRPNRFGAWSRMRVNGLPITLPDWTLHPDDRIDESDPRPAGSNGE